MTVSELEVFYAARISASSTIAVTRAHEIVPILTERDGNDGDNTWLRVIVASETMRQEASGPFRPRPSGTALASSNARSWNASGSPPALARKTTLRLTVQHRVAEDAAGMA